MLAPASCLTLAALRDLPTDLLPPLCEVDAATRGHLLAHLRDVVDGRDPRGLRHPLLPIIVLSIFAVMGGAKSYAAIAGAARDIQDDLADAIGIAHPRFGVPDAETIRRALRLLDVATLEAALRRWATERAVAAAQQRAADPDNRFGATRTLRSVYPMDGKVIRGSALLSETDTEEPGEAPFEQVAVFSVLDAASGIVLTQNPIVAGDEVAAAHRAISDLAEVSDLRGCLFTAA